MPFFMGRGSVFCRTSFRCRFNPRFYISGGPKVGASEISKYQNPYSFSTIFLGFLLQMGKGLIPQTTNRQAIVIIKGVPIHLSLIIIVQITIPSITVAFLRRTPPTTTISNA